MGLFSGRRPPPVEARSMTLPWGLTSMSPMAQLTGFATTDASGENALRSVAVGTSVDLICSVVSELPLDVFRDRGQKRKQVPTPGWLDDPGGDGQGLQDWLYQLLQSWLYRGNAYGVVLDADGTDPRQIRWIHPDEVSVIIDPGTGQPQWRVNGLPMEDHETRFAHWRVMPAPGRLLGASVIERHALQVGVTLAAAQYGSQWFTDGAHPSGILLNSEQAVNQEQATTIKSRWMSLFQGTREPAVMGKGWDWKPIQITPGESQFLETQRFTEAQCARMFGPAMAETLGYETGGSMTYANVVDRRSDLLTFTLNRWLSRVEGRLSKMLPAPLYARFNRDAFLESTTLARFEAHSRALADRWRTVNEVRELEDLPPVDWGDIPNEKAAPAAGGGN